MNTSLFASVTKSTKERSPQIIHFDKFHFYQNLIRIRAYVLRLIPSHVCYRNANVSKADGNELDEAGRHMEYLDQGESFLSKKSLRKQISLME